MKSLQDIATIDPNTIIGWGKIFLGVAAAYTLYKVAQTGAELAGAAKETITKDLNPVSTDNIIYRNIAGGSLGSKIYDWVHGDENLNDKLKKRGDM